MDQEEYDIDHNPFADSVSPLHQQRQQQSEQSEQPQTVKQDDPLCNTRDESESIGHHQESESKHRSSSVMNSNVPVEIDLALSQSSSDQFVITIHDPQTVGDRLKAHTIYSITTKTDSSLFKSRQATVQRRFKEFLWLNQQLAAHNPGVIVPPAPEKHALGRFEEDFVQNRRIQLERMLQKVALHPILNKDPFFIMFLEADTLQTDTQDSNSKKSTGKSSVFSLFTDMNLPKMQETDEFFEQKKIYVESLDNQLKAVAKAVDSLIKYRENLGNASMEFSESIIGLGQSEINKVSEKNLMSFAQVQKQLKDLYSRQSEYDLLYLANTVDEYLRLVQAIKNAFNSRVRAYTNWQQDEQNLIKLRISLEKARLKTKSDKLSQIEAEILEAESKVITSKKEFEEVSKVLKNEMEGFEKEKAHDLQECMKGFLKAVVTIQTQIVRVWEEYVRDMEVINIANANPPSIQ